MNFFNKNIIKIQSYLFNKWTEFVSITNFWSSLYNLLIYFLKMMKNNIYEEQNKLLCFTNMIEFRVMFLVPKNCHRSDKVNKRNRNWKKVQVGKEIRKGSQMWNFFFFSFLSSLAYFSTYLFIIDFVDLCRGWRWIHGAKIKNLISTLFPKTNFYLKKDKIWHALFDHINPKHYIYLNTTVCIWFLENRTEENSDYDFEDESGEDKYVIFVANIFVFWFLFLLFLLVNIKKVLNPSQESRVYKI